MKHEDMTLVDAEIRIVTPANRKGVKVNFVLDSYKLSTANNFSEVSLPGTPAPILQFVNGQAAILSMTVYFDSTERGVDVRELTKNILELMDIDEQIHAPPVLSFSWKGSDFTCVLESTVQEFLSLFPDGRPASAKLDLTFKERLSIEERTTGRRGWLRRLLPGRA